MTSITSGVFTDFCQAWVARFPGSELPAAWEEDVRANLKKHKTKVAILREELEKEEMYVEYLDKLLIDIEQHRKLSTATNSNNSTNSPAEPNKQMNSPNYHTLEEIERLTTHHIEQNEKNSEEGIENKMNNENKRRSDTLETHDLGDENNYSNNNSTSASNKEGTENKPQLKLDINSANYVDDACGSEVETAKADDIFEGSTFVTVINVSSASANEIQKNHDNGSELEQSELDNGYEESHARKETPSQEDAKQIPQPSKRSNLKKLGISRESLNSTSSPAQTPVDSPLISPSSTEEFGSYPREGMASRPRAGTTPSSLSTFNSSISSTSTSSSSHSDRPESLKQEISLHRENKPSNNTPQTSESLKRSHPVTKRALTLGSLTTVSHNTFEKRRGQPDGMDVEEEEDITTHAQMVHRAINEPVDPLVEESQLARGPSVKDLKANWEKSKSRETKVSLSEIDETSDQNKGKRLPSSQRMPAIRKDSDSSGSRGRMGSPSGKSHDSSDSETAPTFSQGLHKRQDSNSPSGRRRVSGETRLDRLVRRPSSDNKNQYPPEPPPLSGIPRSSHRAQMQYVPKAKPRNISRERIIENDPLAQDDENKEPIYDQVANDDTEVVRDDEYYDNHLLCSPQSSLSRGRDGKTGTIRSGGASSADLGFDEPPIMHHAHIPQLSNAQSGLSIDHSGTLSSGGTTASDGIGSPRGLRRGMSMEEEGNYVNIQYMCRRNKKLGSSSNELGGLDPSDDELDNFEDDVQQPDEVDYEGYRLPHGHSFNQSGKQSIDSSFMARASTEDASINRPRRMSKDTVSIDPQIPSSVPPLPPQRPRPSMQRTSTTPSDDRKESEENRIYMYKCMLNNFLDSETVYLESLSVMLQYMKAMKVTLSTPNPVIPKEDFDVIFYKIPELHDLHFTFHESLKRQVDRWVSTGGGDGDAGDGITIGHPFKMLASRTKTYAAYLKNYQRALDALHRCSVSHPQFGELTKSIKLRTVKGMQRQGQALSLEDLLHNPVARVQKNCLCLQDLIKYTLPNHPDYAALNDALNTVQNFVNDYNVSETSYYRVRGIEDGQGKESKHFQQQNSRLLVKNSFIVELSEAQRKLRHLFLFNDVLVCAKYKLASGKNEKFTFQLKWYIPLSQALIVEEPSSEPKESNPANLVSLKTQASALRDHIYRIEKEEEMKGEAKLGGNRRFSNMNSTTGSIGGDSSIQPMYHSSKASRKYRDKLAIIEADIVLAAPQLLFQVTNKQGKLYTFFLSSEHERSEWLKSLQEVQKALPPNPLMLHTQAKAMSMAGLQGYLTKYRQHLQTNMGSFLMRSPRDEPLLVGDLVFRVDRLVGLTRPTDLYVVIEIDSYGHYFRKAKTKIITRAIEPAWNEEFMIELEGSENLRILVYEVVTQPPDGRESVSQSSSLLIGRATLELSRTWLTKEMVEQRISMSDVVLSCSMKFLTFEDTMRRVPTTKATGLFGTPIAITCKKEKRAVPFIITSCVREVERRGISEVGIYRVSGSTPDVQRLKKAYENNPYEAEQLLKECDIHSVAGTLKLYLRDLPESLFTSHIYQQLFEAYSSGGGNSGDPNEAAESRKHAYLNTFSRIPQNPNQACIVFLIEHMVRISQLEGVNKMSLHNLATVFGPTMLHAGGGKDTANMTTGTVDVMAQAGILYFFLTRRARGEPIQIVERQV